MSIVSAYEMVKKAHKAIIAYQMEIMRTSVCNSIEGAASKGYYATETKYGLTFECTDEVSAFIVDLKKAGYHVLHTVEPTDKSTWTHMFVINWDHML